MKLYDYWKKNYFHDNAKVMIYETSFQPSGMSLRTLFIGKAGDIPDILADCEVISSRYDVKTNIQEIKVLGKEDKR